MDWKNSKFMANHNRACAESSHLCELLFNELKPKIPNLNWKNGANWCSFKADGVVFAWIGHSPRNSFITIWFLGDLEKMERFSGIMINPRNPTSSTWANFNGNFKVSNQDQIKEAADLLFTESYPVSRR
jgi:hypothetical protein